MASSRRLVVAVLFGVLSAALAGVASADAINLTGGYVDLQSGGGPIVLVGDGGFSVTAFAEWSSVESPVFAVDACNSTPVCAPGRSLSVDATFGNSDVQGAAVSWGGVAYGNVNALTSSNALSARTTSPIVTLPPISDAATVAVPFSMSGLFVHAIAGGAQAVEPLAGSGTLTVTLRRATYPGFPDSWRVSALRWELNSTLPGGWTSVDVGSVAAAGGSAYAGGEFTVAGSGADVWGAADAFQFAFQRFNGDRSLTARVIAEQNTNPFAKAGIMFRRSLLANAGHVVLDVRPNGEIEFMTRRSRGGQTTYVAGARVTLPVWLRLARTGSTIAGSYSYDGSTWTDVGTAALPAPETSVTNMDDGFAGLIVTSHEDGVVNQSMFDRVTAEGGSTSTNLLVSPGFEEYAPPLLGGRGWQADAGRMTGAKSETNQPRTGARNGACWSPSSLDCGIYQDLQAPATGEYTFTIFANADAGGWVGVNVNGALQGALPIEPRGFANYGTPYVVTFSAAAGDTIRVWMYKPAVPGWVVIDDGSLTAAAR